MMGSPSRVDPSSTPIHGVSDSFPLAFEPLRAPRQSSGSPGLTPLRSRPPGTMERCRPPSPARRTLQAAQCRGRRQLLVTILQLIDSVGNDMVYRSCTCLVLPVSERVPLR
jgi:hypothetical protein